MEYNNCSDVFELMDKPKPIFMKSTKIWRKYVLHWCTPEKRSRSLINARNHTTKKGCTHGYEHKSIVARLHEMAEQGHKLSMLTVMVNLNMKRDKKNNPTGEVHHRELQGAIEEYRQKHEATRESK